MKTIPRILILLLFSCLVKSGFSQVEAIPYYNNLNFNHSFFVIAESDAKSNYYAVDLSQFGSSFEKAYFNEIAYQESKLVRLDAGNENVSWFKAKKVYTDLEINNLLVSLKTQTLNMASSMNEFQKQEWLSRNSK